MDLNGPHWALIWLQDRTAVGPIAIGDCGLPRTDRENESAPPRVKRVLPRRTPGRWRHGQARTGTSGIGLARRPIVASPRSTGAKPVPPWQRDSRWEE